ncbi:MAG: hypothetical protein AAF570_18235, partial [Bacteroidota bacterium]
EDRLAKIRACQNIDGVMVPLALFQPPIDPMALVNAVASGGAGALAAAAGGMSTVPHYRFSYLMRKSRELVTKLNSFSSELLGALEKQDSEELSMLQNRQRSGLLAMTTQLKEERIEEAKHTLANLEQTMAGAKITQKHYQDLVDKGMIEAEKLQRDLMIAAAGIHGAVVLSKIVSGLAYVVPQFTVGPFSLGATTGGRQIGKMLEEFGSATQSAAEGLSMAGEVAGVVAQYERSSQDWELQLKTATNEIEAVEHQIKAQKKQITMAEHELELHKKEMEQVESEMTFMKGKFTNKQLYNWMTGKLSGLFYQTYKMGHDMAKQAEQAFVFEKGQKAGNVNYINGAYWDSQKKGLLAGARLDHDIDRMERAYEENNKRGLEITKNISLLELDPLALLNLKTKGECNFRLSEELFDYDFPGHYKRQIKSIALTFTVGEGQTVNATLTQLSHKLVMAPDVKAVKHLVDPANPATETIRADWRANQQIALSHVDQYTENNGMFQLNFDDDRYLPFEGTGAVSNWRLEINGKKGSYNPDELLDVTIKLRYTAAQGGARFASEVKGLLKPFNETAFFDLAYSFADQWNEFMESEENDLYIDLESSMFPNMS